MNSTIRQLVTAGASGATTLAVLIAAPAPAQAVAACGNAPVAFTTVFAAGFACQVGNAVADLFTTNYAAPAGTTASVAFAFLPGDIYDLDLNWNPADPFTSNATFGYRLTLLDPNEVFTAASLDVNGNGVRPGPGQTGGEYAGISRFLDGSLNQLLELTSIDGVRDPAGVDFTPLSVALNQVIVAQGVTTDPQSPSGIRPTINNVSTQLITERRTDTVPGPLGLAGIGAMFATARRLRRRIQAV